MEGRWASNQLIVESFKEREFLIQAGAERRVAIWSYVWPGGNLERPPIAHIQSFLTRTTMVVNFWVLSGPRMNGFYLESSPHVESVIPTLYFMEFSLSQAEKGRCWEARSSNGDTLPTKKGTLSVFFNGILVSFVRRMKTVSRLTAGWNMAVSGASDGVTPVACLQPVVLFL